MTPQESGGICELRSNTRQEAKVSYNAASGEWIQACWWAVSVCGALDEPQNSSSWFKWYGDIKEGRVVVYIRGIEPKCIRSHGIINLVTCGTENTVGFKFCKPERISFGIWSCECAARFRNRVSNSEGVGGQKADEAAASRSCILQQILVGGYLSFVCLVLFLLINCSDWFGLESLCGCYKKTDYDRAC